MAIVGYNGVIESGEYGSSGIRIHAAGKGMARLAIKTFHAGIIVGGRRKISGSAIGSIRETQEMLEFCSKHNITSDVEVIQPDQINEAWDRVQKSDIKYRFVIDLRA